LKNYFFSLQGWQTAKRKDAVLELYGQIGNIYIKLNKLPEARNYLEKCLQLARLIGYKEEIKSSSYNLSRLDSLEQNYQQAYSHYKEYILYRDSIVNEENTKKSLQAQMQYDFDKKEAITQAEQEKKDAEQKRIRSKQYFAIGGLGILLLAVLSIAFIQWRNSKYKQKANLLLLQQKEKVESTLSELKSTQSQLIQSEKMASLGELTAGIAHEIQNPLNFVNNFSEVSTELLDEMITELGKNNKEDAISIAGDVKQNLEKILHHGKQADGIVKGMLQHSRSSSVVKEPTDINKLVDEYLRLAYHGLRAKDKDFNATLKTDYDETIGTINIIPQDIGRVILNLITNSFYAVAEKKKQRPEGYEPTISVSTKKTESDVLISVKDNGNGIPQKLVDKIFQPFFTTKPTGQGTGLGLSLGYDIIKAHGGELKVETKEACPDDPVGRGEGAEFIIQLPR
jgi:signal transduction histidine kinase